LISEIQISFSINVKILFHKEQMKTTLLKVIVNNLDSCLLLEDFVNGAKDGTKEFGGICIEPS
jgi:hypothetical protein